MKIFSGFPSGKVQVTPLPNLFFSELAPAIDNLAELKVTLHIIWLLANKKSRTLFVSGDELRADRTLTQSLAAVDANPGNALTGALESAVARGTLLRLTAPQNGSGDEHLYFLNSASGRRALDHMEQAKEKYLRGGVVRESEEAQIRPNIFALYEQNIGLLTPMIGEELKEAEREYPAAWIEEAFKVAVENNVRKWNYVRKILERWKTEGRADDSTKRRHWWGDEYDKYVNR